MATLAKDTPGGAVNRESVQRALMQRLEHLFATLDESELLKAVAAATPAETLAQIIATNPGVGTSPEGWTEAQLRGALIKVDVVQSAGGLLSPEEVARLLGTNVETVDQQRVRGELLAIPATSGVWRYPSRQFTGSRVRAGLRRVLDAFGDDQDPWIVLSFLVNPDPTTGEGVSFDSLDDESATNTLVEIARTYGEQGAW
jgi:hypothetical protein